MGCETAQGYGIARPMSAGNLSAARRLFSIQVARQVIRYFAEIAQAAEFPWNWRCSEL